MINIPNRAPLVNQPTTAHQSRRGYGPAWRAARGEFERRLSARTMAPALQQERAALRASGLRESDPDAYQRRVFELSVAGYFHDPSKVSGLTPFR